MDMSSIRRQRSFDCNASDGECNRPGDQRCSGGGTNGHRILNNGGGRHGNIGNIYNCSDNAGCGGNGTSGKQKESGGSRGIGDGVRTMSDQTAKVLGVAFLSIAQSVARTEEGMKSIEGKIERTDTAVRIVTQNIQEQGRRLEKLEERMGELEKRLPPKTKLHQSSSFPHPRGEEPHILAIPTIPENVNLFRPGSSCPTQKSPIASTNSCSKLPSYVTTFPQPPRSVSCNTCNQQNSTRPHFSEKFDNLGRHLLKVSHEGRTKDVRKLLDAGADVNFPNTSKWTPLHRAAAKAHADVVSLLLKRGADVHAKTSYGFTPLHTAACNDFSGRCVTMLVEAWSDLDNQDRSLRTPLHYASAYGNEAAVRVLVAAGASRTAQDDEGWTPYDVARAETVRRILGF